VDLIKISPNKERVKSILKMVSLIEERIRTENKEKMAALIVVDYYEMIKELATAALLADGYKTLSHKDLIDYIKEKYSEFDAYETSFLNDLRILRNRISYEGLFIEPSFLFRNEPTFKEIIQKLRGLINKKIS